MTTATPAAGVGIAPGTQLPARQYRVTQSTLIRFCGAALDFAGPHWNDRIARSVALPGTIMHGALISATALRLVNEWTGDPGAVTGYHSRYIKPVAVPDTDTGIVLRIEAVVESVQDDSSACVGLRVCAEDGELFATVRATVRLDRIARTAAPHHPEDPHGA